MDWPVSTRHSTSSYLRGLLLVSLLLHTSPETDKERVLDELTKIQYNQNPQNYVIHNPRSDDQDAIDSRLWGGVVLKKAAGRIGEHLRGLANDELGVTTLQGIFDSIEYVDVVQDLPAQATQIGVALQAKLDSYRQLLLANKALVQSLYVFHKRRSISHPLSCCSLNSSMFSETTGEETSEAAGSAKTSMHTVCDLLPYPLDKSSFNPGRNLTTKFSQNIQRYSAIKWQYFISTQGVQNEFPAHEANTSVVQCKQAQGYRHRDVYTHTVSPQNKNIVVILDRSSSLNMNQWSTAKELAKQIVHSLSFADKVAVLSLADTVESSPAKCAGTSLSSATEMIKCQLAAHIDNLSQAGTQANHTLGLETAFSALRNETSGTILYISKGSIVSLTQPKQVLTAISNGNLRHNGRVVIHTYGLLDERDVMMYQEALLRDMSAQNFTKYGVVYTGATITPGTYHSVCCVDAAAAALNDLFEAEANLEETTAIVSEPHNDLVDRELVVSMTVPCVSAEGEIVGIMGIDLALQDITEQIVHSNRKGLYAFLIDDTGYVIMHPSIERSMRERDVPSHIQLTQFENLPGFDSIVVHDLLTTSNGSVELEVHNMSVQGESVPSPYSITYTYAWYRVDNTPYIVVVRALKSFTPLHEISSVKASDNDGMVYHRLDLGQLPSDETCLHFQQLASFSTSALFLSAKSFERPYEHMSQPETKNMVANYLAYITDSTTYISKPGLKEGVKADAIAISYVNSYWLQRWKSSPYSQFIARRYIASPSGVYRMYPATLTRKLYDPTHTHWYRQASQLPGRIVLTKPVVDAAGSGYTVTLSHSIYEGRSAALHTPRDPIAAVMGADFPTSYFQRILLDTIPTCDSPSMRCFMLDDRGYIITHPDISFFTFTSTLEEQHITHVEPLVANDILGHKWLVQKKQCNSFTDGTVQRYYQFNTSYSATLTNLKAGEQCVRYQMSLIPGTNAFVVMVNETCELRMSAFCPCSITDRRCLNCQRMEQTECECPCECPLASDTCTDDLDTADSSLPSCDLFSDSNMLFKLPNTITRRLAQCVEPKCGTYSGSKRSCMGVVGCVWCEFTSGGHVPLDQAYCSVQRACFGGVLGARTPYNDQIQASTAGDVHHTLLKNTPVGPVTGAILGAILVIVLAVYCYRHSIRRRSLTQDNSTYNGCYHQDIDGYVYHELPTVSAAPPPAAAAAAIPARLNLADMEVGAANISPYRVNENYRPPRPVVTTTESSDHGYSTMTAQEEADTSSSASCKDSVLSTGQDKDSSQLSTIRLPPPPSKSANRTLNRLRIDDSECKKLLPADSCNLRSQAIDESPELERELQPTS